MKAQKTSPLPKHDACDNVKATLDFRGSGVTISVYILQKIMVEMNRLEPCESLQVVTARYAALKEDLEAFGQLTGHQVEIIPEISNEDFFRFVITKTAHQDDEGIEEQPFNQKHLALIVSKDSLEELLTPLGFALTAALVGWKVSLFFQGPGVRVLHKQFRARLATWWMKPFSGMARNQLAATGHLPPSTKLAQMKEHGNVTFYACQPSMDHFGVPLAKTTFPDDIILCEYATILNVLQRADITLYPG